MLQIKIEEWKNVQVDITNKDCPEGTGTFAEQFAILAETIAVSTVKTMSAVDLEDKEFVVRTSLAIADRVKIVTIKRLNEEWYLTKAQAEELYEETVGWEGCQCGCYFD